MSKKIRGALTTYTEWAKHLKKFGKNLFWSKERVAQRKLIKKEKEKDE